MRRPEATQAQRGVLITKEGGELKVQAASGGAFRISSTVRERVLERLLRLLAGLIAPSAGAIRVEGERVAGPARSRAIVFQDYGKALLPWRTALENVLVGLEFRGGTSPSIAAYDRTTSAYLTMNQDAYAYILKTAGTARVTVDSGGNVGIGTSSPRAGLDIATTGTGGSALIIGSAAGGAAMGIEKIDFFWYLKRVTFLALLGYAAGAAVFIAQQGTLF